MARLSEAAQEAQDRIEDCLDNIAEAMWSTPEARARAQEQIADDQVDEFLHG